MTFPLLKAIPLLPADEMQRLWETVRCAAQCARWVVEQSFCLSPWSPGAGCGGSCAVLSDVSPVGDLNLCARACCVRVGLGR